MEATNLVRVCKTSELASGQAKSVKVNDKEIGVFNIKDKYYAIDNICIHAGGPLADSFIDTEKCQVACSWHGWTYDLSSGKCVTHPKQDVFTTTYNVKLQGDEIYIEVK